MYIRTDDKELFRKCREVWNKIIELIGINNAEYVVKTTEDNGDEYIEAHVNKNTSFVKGNPKEIKELVIVLGSIIDDCREISLVQYRY